MSILVRRTGGKWERANDVQFAAEAELQKMQYESPELVSQDRAALFIREAGLPGSGSSDLLGVDTEGNVLIVETKLAKNPEVRRKVIGQILEYAAYLWEMPYENFDQLFAAREGKGIVDLWRDKDLGVADDLIDKIKANLQSGTFRLFIVVDEMNEHLEKTITYVSSRGSGLKLQALEMRTYKTGELEILAPQTHGEFVPPAATPTTAITVEQAMANCPDEHARRLFMLLVDRWKAKGHEVKPGSVGVAFRADVDGSPRSIFWASRGDLQAAFSEAQKYNAPPDAIRVFRSTLSGLKGFDGSKFLHDQQPIVKFALLTENEIERFVEAAYTLVNTWVAATGRRPSLEGAGAV